MTGSSMETELEEMAFWSKYWPSGMAGSVEALPKDDEPGPASKWAKTVDKGDARARDARVGAARADHSIRATSDSTSFSGPPLSNPAGMTGGRSQTTTCWLTLSAFYCDMRTC